VLGTNKVGRTVGIGMGGDELPKKINAIGM
jgi:hypothetical protein